MLNIVLVEPEIPQNTGNIARTCAATGSRLHLVEPLGFSVDDKSLKRAGLDYWHLLDITIYKNYEDFCSRNSGRFFYFSKKGCNCYADVKFLDGDYLVFGKESVGLDEELIRKNYENTLRIPMIEDARSLNLSNSVAVVVYEALRQNGFSALLKKYDFK